MMQVQVNTGSDTPGSGELSNSVERILREKLSRFEQQITRAEVHLNDLNSPGKGGMDKRCQIEVRLAGLQPLSVTDHGESHEQALRGAANKAVSLIETTLGKLGKR